VCAARYRKNGNFRREYAKRGFGSPEHFPNIVIPAKAGTQ
jgi:hypothetical protein